MSIMRITVRTFQNEQHAEMFITISQKIYEDALKDKLKVNFTMIQNTSLKNQVTSIWKYDDEKHLKEIRSYLSKHNSIPCCHDAYNSSDSAFSDFLVCLMV